MLFRVYRLVLTLDAVQFVAGTFTRNDSKTTHLWQEGCFRFGANGQLCEHIQRANGTSLNFINSLLVDALEDLENLLPALFLATVLLQQFAFGANKTEELEPHFKKVSIQV